MPSFSQEKDFRAAMEAPEPDAAAESEAPAGDVTCPMCGASATKIAAAAGGPPMMGGMMGGMT